MLNYPLTTIDETCRKTANSVGLMSLMGARDEAKVIRDLAFGAAAHGSGATAEQGAQFIERNLRPQRRQ